MTCCSFIGRVLLAIIFIGAGVDKFMQPQHSMGLLNSKYPAFYKHLETTTKQFNVQLPAQLSPNSIKELSKEIIFGVGGAEIVLGFFVILNQAWAGQLLSFLTLLFVAVIHNPFISANQGEKMQNQIQGFYTLGIAGALLMVGSSAKKTVAPVAPPPKNKGVATSAPPVKKAKRN